MTTEQYDESRGKLNIVNSLDERIDNVRKTGFADQIIVEDHVGQKVEGTYRKYDIDVFTVGSDWLGAFDYLKDYCEVVYGTDEKYIFHYASGKENPIIRIGVISTGRIANRFCAGSQICKRYYHTQCIQSAHRKRRTVCAEI